MPPTRTLRFFAIGWVFVFLIGQVVLSFCDTDFKKHLPNELITDASQQRLATPLTNRPILVFNHKSDRYYEFGRNEAIQFGLEQLTKQIEYVFLATVACLAFIIKATLGPFLEAENSKYLPPQVLPRMWNAGLACCCSLAFGGVGYGYLPKIAAMQWFSIYDEIAISAMFQFATFFIACLLVLATIPSILAGNQPPLAVVSPPEPTQNALEPKNES